MVFLYFQPIADLSCEFEKRKKKSTFFNIFAFFFFFFFFFFFKVNVIRLLPCIPCTLRRASSEYESNHCKELVDRNHEYANHPNGEAGGGIGITSHIPGKPTYATLQSIKTHLALKLQSKVILYMCIVYIHGLPRRNRNNRRLKP